jgi:hypothetical protein
MTNYISKKMKFFIVGLLSIILVTSCDSSQCPYGSKPFVMLIANDENYLHEEIACDSFDMIDYKSAIIWNDGVYSRIYSPRQIVPTSNDCLLRTNK